MRKRAKGNKARVSVGIVGCASILLAACGSTASASTKTASTKTNLGDVTTQQARKIVTQFSAENNVTNKSVSTTVQAQDETGYALEADNSMFRYEIQSGQGPAWQKTHYKPFYEHAIQLQSIQSQGWPKHFVAITVENMSPTSSASAKGFCGGLFVFVQNHSNGRWRAQSEPSLSASEVAKFQLAPVGAQISSNDSKLTIAPGYLSEQLAGQLTTWGNGGQTPSLLPASVESGSCFDLAWFKNAKKDYSLKNGGGTFTAVVAPATGSQALESYPVRGGGTIVSAVFNIKLVTASAPNYPYITFSHTTGSIIKGVRYSSATHPFLSDVLIYDPPRGHGQPEIIGSYTQELWPATGVLANGSAS
jgi:hypothetical protein